MIFNIGNVGLGIERDIFTVLLTEHKAKTLLDSRYNAYSRNPDFSENKLAQRLDHEEIRYEHLREYGIQEMSGDPPMQLHSTVIKNIRPAIDPPSSMIPDRYEPPVYALCACSVTSTAATAG